MLSRLFGFKKKKKEQCSEPVCEIDEEMKYCPECNDEYRSDMKRCVSCDVPLISGKVKRAEFLAVAKQQSSRSMKIDPTETVVTIQQGPMKDIKALKRVLEAAFIPALLTSDGQARGGCCGGPQLMLQVREADRQHAVTVLTAEFEKSTHIGLHDLSTIGQVYDDSLGETVCPGCNHVFSTSESACPECGLTFVA